MFIPLMVLIGIDPYPHDENESKSPWNSHLKWGYDFFFLSDYLEDFREDWKIYRKTRMGVMGTWPSKWDLPITSIWSVSLVFEQLSRTLRPRDLSVRCYETFFNGKSMVSRCFSPCLNGKIPSINRKCPSIMGKFHPCFFHPSSSIISWWWFQ